MQSPRPVSEMARQQRGRKNLENYLRKKRYKTRFANTSIVMNAIGPSTEGKH